MLPLECRHPIQCSRAGERFLIKNHPSHVLDLIPLTFLLCRCVTNAEFYKEYNYRRALIWTAAMTTLAHTDPAFRTVVSIEAVNEPIMDANQTPGYGRCGCKPKTKHLSLLLIENITTVQREFVLTIRAVEAALGIGHDWLDSGVSDFEDFGNLTSLLLGLSEGTLFSERTRDIVGDAIPYLDDMGSQEVFGEAFHPPSRRRQPLVTT
jgi:glucan endo-1,6-beta-glucosidase